MKIYLKSIILTCVLFLGTGMMSCTKYLDKAPEASISDIEAYGTFMSFQGFTEELYMCTPIIPRQPMMPTGNLLMRLLQRQITTGECAPIWTMEIIGAGTTVTDGAKAI